VANDMSPLEKIAAELDALDGRTVTITKQTTSDRELAERVFAEANRSGGPKLSPKAINS
jgi:hypothetical protein